MLKEPDASGPQPGYAIGPIFSDLFLIFEINPSIFSNQIYKIKKLQLNKQFWVSRE